MQFICIHIRHGHSDNGLKHWCDKEGNLSTADKSYSEVTQNLEVEYDIWVFIIC